MGYRKEGMNYLLLDTNIYLHCQSFESIPWQTLIARSDDFCILLPMQVLRELEGIKDRGEGTVNKRARKVCSRLGDILIEGKDVVVPIITCDMPQKAHFAVGLSPEIADDAIIQSALSFMENHEGTLIAISRDTPFILKAKQIGLPFIRMPEEYWLQANSAEDKEKIRMADELKRLKSRMSAPVITFKDGSTKIHLKRVEPREPKVDSSLPEEERSFLLLQEQESISDERFFILELNLTNRGTAPTGIFTVHLDASKLKTCKASFEPVSMDIPESLQTKEDKEKDWGFCEPYRQFRIWSADDDAYEWEGIDNEYDPLTQGLSMLVGDYIIDLCNAESGSIDWIVYDPALPDPVKGTLYVIVE